MFKLSKFPGIEISTTISNSLLTQSEITDVEVLINEFEIRSPAGMLGIALDMDTLDGEVLNVKEIKSNSPLAG
jgi:hypothetical protein